MIGKSKIIKKILVSTLTLMCSFNMIFYQIAYASENIKEPFVLENTSETIEIDGIIYTYNYFTENGNRVVTISNNTNNIIDKIVYDIKNSNIYLNGELFAKGINNNINKNRAIGTTPDGWQILSKDSDYISWAQGTSVTVIAGMISVALGSIPGATGIISAMGVAALGTIASSSIGGTVYVELHMYKPALLNPSYRYVWDFTSSNGDYYGKYYYHY